MKTDLDFLTKLRHHDSEFPFIEDSNSKDSGPPNQALLQFRQNWIQRCKLDSINHRTGARCRVVPKCSPGCSASSRTSGRRSCGGVTSIIDMGNCLHQNWQAHFFSDLFPFWNLIFHDFPLLSVAFIRLGNPKDLKATFLDGCAQFGQSIQRHQQTRK